MWSYPDPDDEKREGMSDSGGGEGSEADEASFSLAMNDEVRFRVRTLEFTEVRYGPLYWRKGQLIDNSVPECSS